MTILRGHRVPDWVLVLAEDPVRARILARPPVPSGSVLKPYDLTLRHAGEEIEVTETEPGARLPRECPELHILPGGVFCLGIEVDLLNTAEQADQFWTRLGDFLVNQNHAARRRRWPAGRWISHGRAAALAQLDAEAVALKCGWSEDYADTLENDRGWIYDVVNRPESTDRETACPCHVDATRAIRRRCPKCRAARRIVAAERCRREAEGQYFDKLFDRGLRCCGRIIGCGLERREHELRSRSTLSAL